MYSTQPFDLGQFRLSGNGDLQPAKSNRIPRHKTGECFLKGPIPADWLSRAAKLPGKALHVGLAIWFLAGLRASRRVKLTQKALSLFGVNRSRTVYDGLQQLQSAGLIAVKRKRGRRPVVSIEDTLRTKSES